MEFFLILIIIGLILDVFGALMIIGPIRSTKNWFTVLIGETKEIMDNLKDKRPDTHEITISRITNLETKILEMKLKELENYPKIMKGAGVLVLGFILQAIGVGWQLFNSTLAS